MVELIHYDLFGEDRSSKREDKLNQILNGYGKDFNIYTIDRILRINKVYIPDNWDIEVTVKEDLAKKLEDLINRALSIEDMNDRINFLLMLEYGSIHPKLIDVNYSIIEIDKDLIIYGSQSNKKSALKEIQNSLKYHYDDNYNRLKSNNIKGIVIPEGDRWRLIDGYHRCLSTSKKMIKVIVGNK
jgi:hypothetical protein